MKKKNHRKMDATVWDEPWLSTAEEVSERSDGQDEVHRQSVTT